MSKMPLVVGTLIKFQNLNLCVVSNTTIIFIIDSWSVIIINAIQNSDLLVHLVLESTLAQINTNDDVSSLGLSLN